MTHDELIAEVEQRLGRPVFVSGNEGLVLRSEVRGVGGTWNVELILTTADGRVVGTRQLQQAGESCQGLNDALALVVALMVDLGEADLKAKLAALPAKPQPRPSTPIRLPPPSPPPLRLSPSQPPQSTWVVFAQGGGGLGLGPQLNGSGRLGLGWHPHLWPGVEV